MHPCPAIVTVTLAHTALVYFCFVLFTPHSFPALLHKTGLCPTPWLSAGHHCLAGRRSCAGSHVRWSRARRARSRAGSCACCTGRACGRPGQACCLTTSPGLKLEQQGGCGAHSLAERPAVCFQGRSGGYCVVRSSWEVSV